MTCSTGGHMPEARAAVNCLPITLVLKNQTKKSPENGTCYYSLPVKLMAMSDVP